MAKKITVFDRNESSKVTKTQQGFLRVDGYVTRTGVLKYKTADGKIVRQLRDPKEVFNQDSLDTLKSVPVTLRHPPKLITVDDVNEYIKGYSSDSIEKEGNKLKTTLTITSKDAIKSVEDGETVELSCGYECELEESNGVFNGEEYDAIQRNIKYNHIALVERGRAGSDVRVLMDSDNLNANAGFEHVYVMDEGDLSTQEEKLVMEKIMVEGKEFEVSPELALALKEMMAKKEAMEVELDGMKKEKQDLSDKCAQDKAKMDAVEAELEKTKTELKSRMDSDLDEKKIEEKVKARLSLIDTAKRYIADDKLSEMSEQEIKKAVIAKDLPSINLDGKDESYVSNVFSFIVEKTKASDEKLMNFGKKISSQNQDSQTVSSEEARKKAMERAKDGWKTPIGKTLSNK